MKEKSCRLCSTVSTDDYLNIFSDRGAQLGMADILQEHFKCDVNIKSHSSIMHSYSYLFSKKAWLKYYSLIVKFPQISEVDPLPNVVCEVCWKTTDAFHELYKKSKEVQEKFLNSLIKDEPDPIDIEPSSDVECNIAAEISLIKMEVSSGNGTELQIWK